jgi:hypothetical protein
MLIANRKIRKEVCAYEKTYTYKKGALEIHGITI